MLDATGVHVGVRHLTGGLEGDWQSSATQAGVRHLTGGLEVFWQ